jgi:hypothetical protein
MAEDLTLQLGITGLDDVTKQVESLGKGVEKSFGKIGDAVKGAGASLDKITEALGGAADTAAKFGEPGLKVAQALSAISDAAGPLKEGLGAVSGAFGNLQKAAADLRQTLPDVGKELGNVVSTFRNLRNIEGLPAKIDAVSIAFRGLGFAINRALGVVGLLIDAYYLLEPLLEKLQTRLNETFNLKPDLSWLQKLQADAVIAGGKLRGLADEQIQKQLEQLGLTGKKAGEATAQGALDAADALKKEQQAAADLWDELVKLSQQKGPEGPIDYRTDLPRTYTPGRDVTPPTYNFQHGGLLHGPGTTTSDSIPIRASRGEYVVNAKAVSHYGVGVMDSLNRMRLAFGGLVGYAGGGSVCDWQKIEDLFSVRLRLQKQAKSALYADEAAAIYKQADQITKELNAARKACGYASGGFVGLDRPIGFASGGCVGCANMTERRFQAGGFAGASGLSSIATNLQGGGGLRNASHDVHLHLADGSSFKLQGEAAVVGTMMRSAAVQRMARIGRRSPSEG